MYSDIAVNLIFMFSCLNRMYVFIMNVVVNHIIFIFVCTSTSSCVYGTICVPLSYLPVKSTKVLCVYLLVSVSLSICLHLLV